MSQKTKARTDARETKFARWQLAIETLDTALQKDRSGMLVALGTIEEGHLLCQEECSFLQQCINRLQSVNDRLGNLFAALLTEGARRKVWDAQFRARTLTDEIAVLRESAFWLLDENGVLTVEKLIGEQVRAYRDVRFLLRSLMAKVAEGEPHQDAAEIPAIPANRYLAITHPELVA